MATSTLDPDNTPEPDRSLGRGHDDKALGPGDISDTGSDVQPGMHAIKELDIGLDKGTNEDPDSHNIDPDVKADSDLAGTGEQSTAGRQGDVKMDRDIGVDRIDHIDAEDTLDYQDQDESSPPPRRSPQANRPPNQR